MKLPGPETQARIRMELAKVLLELEIDPNDVESMTVDAQGITFSLTIPMRIAPLQ